MQFGCFKVNLFSILKKANNSLIYFLYDLKSENATKPDKKIAPVLFTKFNIQHISAPSPQTGRDQTAWL